MFEIIYECEDIIVVMAKKQTDYEVCNLESPVVQDLLKEVFFL